MTHFPPPPSGAIDWNNLGFDVRQVNGHIESRINTKTGQWSPPQLVKNPNISVHGLSPCFNYGQQAYEGMKAHRSPKGQILLFRPADHARRLAHSSSFVMIPSIPEEHFMQCIRLAIANNAEFVPPHNSRAALYIRPVVFGSSPNIALAPSSEYTFCVYVQPFQAYHGINAIPAVVMEEFDRVAPKGTGAAKIGGNYSPSMPWMMKARLEGYGMILHLDSKTQTEIEEFATSSFIGLKGGCSPTLVIPESDSIVSSITSDSCAQLAESLGWSVEKRRVVYSELGAFDEVIAASTAACLVGVSSITRKSKAETFTYSSKGMVRTNGENGQVNGNGHMNGHSNGNGFAAPDSCRQVLDSMLRNIQRGVVEDIYGWTERVRPSEEIFAEMETRD